MMLAMRFDFLALSSSKKHTHYVSGIIVAVVQHLELAQTVHVQPWHFWSPIGFNIGVDMQLCTL